MEEQIKINNKLHKDLAAVDRKYDKELANIDREYKIKVIAALAGYVILMAILYAI